MLLRKNAYFPKRARDEIITKYEIASLGKLKFEKTLK